MRKLKLIEHISLFEEGTPARALALDSTKALPSGIVINNYKTAGPLRTASFGEARQGGSQ
jgi:hypothetical protein